MGTASAAQGAAFTTRKLAIGIIDLAGYARLASRLSDLEIAQFLSDYYAAIREAVGNKGRVVKHMGDGVLCAFASERAADAVSAFQEAFESVAQVARKHNVSVTCGANIHMEEVIEGEFEGRYDIVGSGVNHTFLMGRGAGLRISEPVYRSLPNQLRTPWEKQKPPAVYTWQG